MSRRTPGAVSSVPIGGRNPRCRRQSRRLCSPYSLGNPYLHIQCRCCRNSLPLSQESEGCPVAPAVFKTVVGMLCKPRQVRLLPSPFFQLLDLRKSLPPLP